MGCRLCSKMFGKGPETLCQAAQSGGDADTADERPPRVRQWEGSGLGFRVWGLGFRVLLTVCRVWGSC